MATPAKGKARVKVTSSGKRVSYGQAGQAKGGGPRVKPGTSKGNAYCARSAGQMKKHSAAAKTPTVHYVCRVNAGSVLDQRRGTSHGKETRLICQHQQAPQGGHVTAQEQVNDFIESLQQHESWLS